jgi:RHS repeat-associated protein
MRRLPFPPPKVRPLRRRALLRIETLEARDVPAAVFWDGGAGTTNWNNPLNWSGDVLPTAADDVTVSTGNNAVITLAGASATVQSLSLSSKLEVDGGVGLTVTNGFTMDVGRSLTVDGSGSTFSAAGSTTIDGASLYASNGGHLSLPGLTAYTHTGPFFTPVEFFATGASSVLNLSALTTITGSTEGFTTVHAKATGGGQVNLSSLTTAADAATGDTTGRTFQFEANGSGSLINLSTLTALNDGDPYRGVSALTATAGGEVRMPLVTSLANTTVTIDGSTSVLPTDQLTSIVNGGLVLAGVGNVRSFPNLTVLDGSNVAADSGATLALPVLTSYTHTGVYDADVVLEASGANSLLDLSALAGLTGSTDAFCNVTIRATGGGHVDASHLTTVTDPANANTVGRQYFFEANGTGSLLDLSALTALNDIDPYRGQSGITATAGGEVRVPLITSLANTVVTIDGSTSILPTNQMTAIVNGGLVVAGAGNVRSFPALTSVDGSSLSADGGATLALPVLTSYTHTGAYFTGVVLEASGANSLLNLSSLTGLTGSTEGFCTVTVRATGSGHVDLSHLPATTDQAAGSTTGRAFTFEADGAGSLVDLSALTALNDSDGYRGISGLTVTAGGEVRVPSLTALANTAITIDGATSILPINQITAVVDGAIVVTGAGNTRSFLNLANADGSVISARAGSHLTLLALTTYTNTGTGYFDTTITGFPDPVVDARGANSVLDLPALTTLIGSATVGFSSLTLSATATGIVHAPALTAIHDPGAGGTTSIGLAADAAGSLLDLPSLSSFVDDSGFRGISRIDATAGGEIRTPNLASLAGVYVNLAGATSQFATDKFTSIIDGAIEVSGTGNARAFQKLTNIDGSSLIASGGARLALPAVLGYTAAGNGYAINPTFGAVEFQSDTGGSIDLPALSSLNLVAADLTISVPALTLQTLTVSGGTLFGDTPISVSGDFTWSGGYLRGTSAITIADTATARITGTGYKYLDQTIENAGALTSDGTNFYFGWNASEPGQIINDVGATFTLSGNGDIDVYNANASHAIINNGTLIRTNVGTTQVHIPLTNTGTIRVLQGTLDLAAGGSIAFDDPAVLSTRPGATLLLPASLDGTTASAAPFTPLGTLTFKGGTAGVPRKLEAMGRDLGAAPEGFVDNFTYGAITLNSAYVQLVNTTDNAPGNEAVYIDTLVVPIGSTLDLNSIPLYARAVQIGGLVVGGTVTVLPDGGPLPLSTPAAGNIAVSSEVDEWTVTARAGQSLHIVADPGANPPPPVAPTLGRVQVQVLDLQGTVIASASSAGANQTVDLPVGPLLADGNYRVRISAAAPATTGHYRLAIYDGSITTRPLALNERTTGDTHSPYATDLWTFAAAANQSVQFDLIGSAAAGLRFTLTGPNGFIGFTDLADDSGPVTLTETGVYTLKATSYGAESGAYTFSVGLLSLATLTPGGSFTGQLAGTGFAQLFEVDVTDAGPLTIGLDVVDSNARTEVYVRLASPPTRGSFDYTSADGPGADHTVLVPFAAPGKWYVLVYGAAVPGPPNFTISADSLALVLNTSIPKSAPSGLVANLTLTGAGFVPGTQVELVSGANVYAASAIAIDSITRVTAGFDLTTVPLGSYDVRVTIPGGATKTLPTAFQVVAPGQPQFKTNVVIPTFLGRHATATLYVEYENAGVAPMPAPVLTFQSADADNSDRPLLTLDQSRLVEGFWTSAYPDGFSSSVQILASGATPGILGPGERVRVPVYYAGLVQPWSFTDSTIEFEVQVHEAGDPTPIDWAGMSASLKPAFVSADAWPGVYASLQAIVGPTWGDYVRTLGANAAYLDRLGEAVTDVGQLWAFAMQQAIGLPAVPTLATATDASMPTPGLALSFGRSYGSTITERYQVGPFGRGWSAPWQTSLAQFADGTIVVLGSGNTQRRFQPDSRTPGAYFAQAGDTGTLKVVGGGYELTNPDGKVTRFRGDGTLEFIQDANGNRITTTFTGGRLTGLAHSSGASLTIGYNAAGLIGTITDSAGRVTTYGYDATNAYLTMVTGPGGTTTYQYDAGTNPAIGHALTSVTDPAGVTRTFEYDALGRLSAASLTGAAERVTYAYANGQVTSTDGGGVVTKLFFDHKRLLVRTEDGTGSYTRYEFDDQRRPVRVTDALGRSQKFSYTATGAPAVRTDVYGNTATFVAGGPNDNPAAFKNANGQVTHFGYDAAGNRATTTYPDGTVETATFDALGDPIRLVNRRGQVTTRTFNAAGQLLTETFPDAPPVSYTYDARGRLATATDNTGVTTFTYDTSDRLTRVDYPLSRWITYGYDPAGRRTRMDDSTGYVVQYAYDTAGRLKQLQNGVGTPLVTYTYDAAGRVSRQDNANGTYTVNTFDGAGRSATVVNHAPNNSVVSSFAYTYDPSGRRITSTTLDGTWTYAYDLTGQLIHAVFASTGSVPSQDLTYEYDAAGNRARTVLNGASDDYTTNNLDQYTSAGATVYQYDLDGNLISTTGPSGTTTFTYDSKSQLVHANSGTDSWTFDYDAFGNRIASTFNGQRTDFLVDPTGIGSVTAESTGASTTHYLYGTGLAGRTDAAGTAFFNFDAAGNTAELTGTGGSILGQYAYDPFGTVIASNSSDPNAYQFGGKYGLPTDATGLVFMRARYYDPTAGRFISADPLRLATGDPNLYRYASNSPAEFADPTGQATTDRLGNPTDGPPLPDPVPAPGPTPPTPGPDPVPEPAPPDPTWGDDPPPSNDPGTTPPGIDNPPATDDPDGSLDVIEHTDDLPPPPPPPPPPPSFGGWEGVSGAATSTDPNEKLGPVGYGPQAYVGAGTLLSYQIKFENRGPGSVPTPVNPATAPAQRVEVTDQLSTDFDWSTFRFDEFGFGDTVVAVPTNRQAYSTAVPFTYNGQTFNVQVDLGFDPGTGLIRVVFQSVDAKTSLPPDVLTGFLPPEDGTGRGQGYLKYTVQPKAGLTTGTVLKNIADIRFDGQAAIGTNQVDPDNPAAGTDPTKEARNTIDAAVPVSRMNPLPGLMASTAIPLGWSGSDPAGAGLDGFDVYVGIDGNPAVRWLSNTKSTSAVYTGQVGHRYNFFSIAHDLAGNVEGLPASPQALTVVADLPAARDDAFVFKQDKKFSVGAGAGLLKNDVLTGLKKKDLTVELVAGPAHAIPGTFSLLPNGSFTYTPTAGFNGRDSFTYHIKDALGHPGNSGVVELATNLVSFKSATVKASEKTSAKLTFNLAKPATAATTIAYQVAPQTAGDRFLDFTLADGTVTFDVGKKSVTGLVPLTNDSLYEGTETFQVWLRDPGGNTAIGRYGVVTVSILDDDKPPTVSFHTVTASGPEGTPASIEVILSAVSALPVTINFAVTLKGTTATPNVDFTLLPGTLTFAPGEPSKFIVFPVPEDAIDESDETIVIGLSKPTGAKLKGITALTYTILDNDP